MLSYELSECILFLSALNFWFFCFKTKELKRKETPTVALFSKKTIVNS